MESSKTPGENSTKYTIDTLLGKGGMGSVWRVVDNTLLLLACKMLHQNKAGHMDEREKFSCGRTNQC